MAESKKPQAHQKPVKKQKPNWGLIAGIAAIVIVVIIGIIVAICMMNNKKDIQY